MQRGPAQCPTQGSKYQVVWVICYAAVLGILYIYSVAMHGRKRQYVCTKVRYKELMASNILPHL